MNDVADDANERAEQFLQVALKNRTHRSLSPTGFCFYCNELIGQRLFCDAECRDGYDEERRLRAIGGRT